MWVFVDIFFFLVAVIVLFFMSYIAIYGIKITYNEWRILDMKDKFNIIMLFVFIISIIIAAIFGIYLIVYSFMNPELTRMQVFIYGIKKIWWDYLLMGA